MREEYLSNWIKQDPKPRFHNAQVGDEVYCRLNGNGIVVAPNHTPSYASVFVSFGSGFRNIYYHIDDRLTDEAAESTLFYRKGKEKYLTERPESEVDWAKAAGAKVKVCDLIQDKEPEEMILAFYKPELKYSFWVYDVDRDDIVYGYKYCSLAEPCKPEWRK